MAAVQRLIDAFVLRSRAPGSEGADNLVRGQPSAAIMRLPPAEGGLGAADVEMQATALRAKVAARLLHPQRRPWKWAADAAFEAALPGLGVGALLTAIRPQDARARGLPRRLASYWDALRAVHPHRLLQPGDMSPAQVRIEPIAGNRRVVGPGGRRAMPWGAALRECGEARRLRDCPPATPDGGASTHVASTPSPFFLRVPSSPFFSPVRVSPHPTRLIAGVAPPNGGAASPGCWRGPNGPGGRRRWGSGGTRCVRSVGSVCTDVARRTSGFPGANVLVR